MRTYALYGFLFGLCFPLGAFALQLWRLGPPLTWEKLLAIQQDEPLLWIIETAPLILGWLAALIGRGHDHLMKVNAGLQDEVMRQTEDLRVQNTQLTQEVETRKRLTEELTKAKIEAESAAQVKSQFLSTMSHEIRTPMNAVIGMTGLLQDSQLDVEQREFVDTIRISSNNLLSIINDILDFSKIEAGKMEVESIELDLQEPLEDALDLLSGKAAEKKLELTLAVEKDVPRFILSDPAKIQQVLINLVNNAIKFTEQGDIQVGVQCLQRDAKQAQIQVSVRDTGIGIPADKISRLFQSFSQADASTTRQFGGTGLGLAICKRLVDMLGGEIWVESVSGKGSTFHFTIQAPVAEREWVLPDVSQLTGKRVLLVDDNETNLKILAYQCREWGLHYSCYESGADVLAAHPDELPWDFAILDMEMPQLDGAQLARELRKRSQAETFPFLLLSSVGMELPAEDKALFHSVLLKPARKSLLLRRMLALYSEAKEPSSGFDFSHTSQNSSQQDMPPLRILVAEDNAVNQKVAKRMLHKLGYDVDIVANGQEAVDTVTMVPYDIVLMDVQMPVLDGLAATRTIREQAAGSPNPVIIAMTANAFKEDQEACLAAGMDDYLSKPVQVKDLAQKLLKWGQQLLPETA